jgi:hypothetical protein
MLTTFKKTKNTTNKTEPWRAGAAVSRVREAGLGGRAQQRRKRGQGKQRIFDVYIHIYYVCIYICVCVYNGLGVASMAWQAH